MKSLHTQVRTLLLTFFVVAALAIFTKTKLDENNYAGLASSVSEMYKDRLVVESYIYRLNDLINSKKILLLKSGSPDGQKQSIAEILKINLKIDQLLSSYAATKFTTSERTEFANLQTIIARSHHSETAASVLKLELTPDKIFPVYDEATKSLRVLSDIQVSQGRHLSGQTHSTVASLLLAIRLEWALYVLILAALVALYRDKQKRAIQRPSHLLN